MSGFDPLLGLENAVVGVVSLDGHASVPSIPFPHLIYVKSFLC